MVKNGDYIYIDSGTTPLAMVKYIDADRVTIVTSNIMITEFLPQQGLNVSYWEDLLRINYRLLSVLMPKKCLKTCFLIRLL